MEIVVGIGDGKTNSPIRLPCSFQWSFLLGKRGKDDHVYKTS
jgi:hypothetical protein